MSTQDRTDRNRRLRTLGIWIVASLLVLSFVAALPGAWARPNQAPDYQTVPTRTPTPTAPGTGPTPTATRPGAQPTDTPPPASTPRPTDTPQPGQPTATWTPSPLPLPPLPAGSDLPASCFTLPTPGFSPVRLASLTFDAESDYSLVVPGQVVTLRLRVTNAASAQANGLVICYPVDRRLAPGLPVASQGQAYLVENGLVAELGSLAPGATAEVSLDLGIAGDVPLGGVIESQGWLFAGGLQTSTDLLTWALPPAWLPPTGD